MELIPVRSGNIAAVGYDTSNGDLQVRFHNGKTFQYSNVNPKTYENMLTAESVGSYFHRYIRSAHKYQEVEPKPTAK